MVGCGFEGGLWKRSSWGDRVLLGWWKKRELTLSVIIIFIIVDK